MWMVKKLGRAIALDLIWNMSEHPRLVAVKCANTGEVDGGVLVSISNRTVTNGMWAVELPRYNDWMELTYSEAYGDHWHVPHVLGTNAEQPNGWPYRHGYGDNAKWLWASAYSGFEITAYFRGTLGESPLKIPLFRNKLLQI